VYFPNQGKTNYARLGLVVDIFGNIFREIMRCRIAPDYLYTLINEQFKIEYECLELTLHIVGVCKIEEHFGFIKVILQ
jgi:hypothetical protein